jgi:glycosyltransferase involved in cell wall biosynthesis
VHRFLERHGEAVAPSRPGAPGALTARRPGSEGRPSASLIIPALNEASNLPHVLSHVPEFVDELIVVDGASTDGTVGVARSLVPWATVLIQEGRGKGGAIRAGLREAKGDWVFLMDADGSHSMAELGALADGLSRGFDVVHGSRFLPGGGSEDLTFVRRVGNRALTAATNTVHRSRYTDVCYGLMGMQRHVAKSLRIECDDIVVEAEILCRVADLGYSVLEVPSFEGRRLSGSSHFNGFVIGVKNAAIILKTQFEQRSGSVAPRAWTEPRVPVVLGSDPPGAAILTGKGQP